MRDLYEMLGVPHDASEADIKRAYRRQAQKLHPDAGGDEGAFKELTAAYEVLRNPQTRANYDRYGDPRGPGGVSGDSFAGFGDLSDLIETFFGGFGGGGGGAQRTASRSGRDAMVELTLTLDEAAHGTTRDIDLTVARACDTCGGDGAAPGSGIVRCNMCGGAGQVQQVRQSVFGQVLTSSTCPRCRGRGQRVAEPCPDCRGEGRREVAETVTVDIEPGVDDGTRLRLGGRGEAGRMGGRSGDLYVRVRLAPHEVFERDGNDLHCHLRIPMTQAALGVELQLPTLYGETTLRIPPGTNSGDVLRVRRQGMPKLNGGGARGDLHVHCRVETPTSLTEEQEGLLRRLGELRGEDKPPLPSDDRNLFDRLRGVFGA